MNKNVGIAYDHRGHALAKRLLSYLESTHEWIGVDVMARKGVVDIDQDMTIDYPRAAQAIVDDFKIGTYETAVAICGTGVGISIALNRNPHIYAALVHSPVLAQKAREHNNANVLCFGSEHVSEEVAIDCVRTFLITEFAKGRHEKRLNLLEELAKSYHKKER